MQCIKSQVLGNSCIIKYDYKYKLKNISKLKMSDLNFLN